MSAVFEIFTDEADQYRFRLKAANGEIVAQSAGYTTKQNAQDGVDAVKRAAAEAEISDLT